MAVDADRHPAHATLFTGGCMQAEPVIDTDHACPHKQRVHPRGMDARPPRWWRGRQLGSLSWKSIVGGIVDSWEVIVRRSAQRAEGNQANAHSVDGQPRWGATCWPHSSVQSALPITLFLQPCLPVP
eukprot:46521-Pelagomonas_calceolata.AAC.3